MAHFCAVQSFAGGPGIPAGCSLLRSSDPAQREVVLHRFGSGTLTRSLPCRASATPHAKGFDGNGVFIALGNVSCRASNNDWGKVTAIDGNLVASDLVISCYEDSTLVVTRDLKTRFFYGRDIWAEVGGVAEMEYGKGYCLPIGYRNAAQDAIRPRQDAETSMALLTVAESGALIEYELVDKLKQGQPVFKQASRS